MTATLTEPRGMQLFDEITSLLDQDNEPLGFEAGDANLYRYVGNSPLNGVDPSGLAEGFWGGVERFDNALGFICTPWQLPKFISIRDDSYDFADEVGHGEDGRMEAGRHAYWQARLTLEWGAGFAYRVGENHELGEGGNPDSRRDRWNNDKGRDMGMKARAMPNATECEKIYKIKQMVRRGLKDHTLITDVNDKRLFTTQSQ